MQPTTPRLTLLFFSILVGALALAPLANASPWQLLWQATDASGDQGSFPEDYDLLAVRFLANDTSLQVQVDFSRFAPDSPRVLLSIQFLTLSERHLITCRTGMPNPAQTGWEFCVGSRSGSTGDNVPYGVHPVLGTLADSTTLTLTFPMETNGLAPNFTIQPTQVETSMQLAISGPPPVYYTDLNVQRADLVDDLSGEFIIPYAGAGQPLESQPPTGATSPQETPAIGAIWVFGVLTLLGWGRRTLRLPESRQA